MGLIHEPGRIGSLTVPRRSVFPAMLMNYCSDRGEVTERLIGFYRRLARGGFGLIVTECIFPQFKGGIATRGLALYDDRFIPGFRRLAAAVHEEGALLGAQIFFDGAGRTFASEETVSIGPSDLTPWNGPFMRPMRHDDLEIMTADFAAASRRAIACGADLIELHMGHGHLLGRFASPYWNRREDEFGGLTDARMRFPLMVLAAVRDAVGDQVPITARFCLSEQIEGGIELPEAIAIGKILKRAGLDAIHTSVGTGTSPKGLASIFPTSFAAEAPFARWAAEFKRDVGITTIFAGKVTSHGTAERLLAEGAADFISVGRAALADPDWPSRTPDQTVPCIGCNQGCTDSLISRKEIVCTVNPSLGFEAEFASVVAAKGQPRYGVIGAGPAGITCALALSDRGASVTLYDTAEEIGGLYRYCEKIPGKEQYGRYMTWLQERVQSSSIVLKLGPDAISAEEDAAGFDQLFWAGGSVPKQWPSEDLSIPVIDGWEFLDAPELLQGPRHVVVVGAGQIGCDAAIWLANIGHSVILCDRDDDPLGAFRARRFDYERALLGRMVTLHPSTEVVAKGGDTILLKDCHEVSEQSTDIIITAVGRLSRTRPVFATQAIAIGDAARVGTALEAIRQGTFHGAFTV
ncbi:FAD-dependent oxidoreductase [Rhodoligotrophos appendicifer]|uniref:oxidoreductase n=1 Tax=Rhodoligotrophos appendicifer TaxID=987056 RepID=UPI001184A640|nr:FAD-dependent oxidoreductase [Rhodoligotrophos appendicifer]